MTDCPERKSLEDFKQLYLNKLQAKLCPDSDIPPNDPLAIAQIVNAGLAFMQDGNTHRLFRSYAFIDDMCCDYLIERAREDGVYQRPATSASGCILITGNVGAAIPADLQFTGTDNIIYSLDPSATNPAVIGLDGTATVCVSADEPGVSGNFPAGADIETYESYPDIDADAVVDETGLFGGSDQEDCEALRARYKERKQGFQACGTKQWYIDRILEYPGVTKVCCATCECSECGGCCQSGYLIFYPLFEGYPNGIAPQGVSDALTEYIFGVNPGDGSGIAQIGAAGEFISPETVDITYEIGCIDSPSPAQVEAIASALQAWTDANLCVGGSYCIAELTAVVKNAAPELCPCNIHISGEGVTNTPDGCAENGQIPCGKLPVFSGINFSGA